MKKINYFRWFQISIVLIKSFSNSLTEILLFQVSYLQFVIRIIKEFFIFKFSGILRQKHQFCGHSWRQRCTSSFPNDMTSHAEHMFDRHIWTRYGQKLSGKFWYHGKSFFILFWQWRVNWTVSLISWVSLKSHENEFHERSFQLKIVKGYHLKKNNWLPEIIFTTGKLESR